jgi:hypothetical protein
MRIFYFVTASQNTCREARVVRLIHEPRLERFRFRRIIDAAELLSAWLSNSAFERHAKSEQLVLNSADAKRRTGNPHRNGDVGSAH